uniref:Uncharacterized protein n=1 Tax=Glossina palpalis gambiensis TaxID=67801 RepID=A0A1B0BJT3_9MUSC
MTIFLNKVEHARKVLRLLQCLPYIELLSVPIMTADRPTGRPTDDDNVNGDGVRAKLLRLSGVSLLICEKSNLRTKRSEIEKIAAEAAAAAAEAAAAIIITYAAMSLWFSKSNERKKERNPKFISRCMKALVLPSLSILSSLQVIGKDAEDKNIRNALFSIHELRPAYLLYKRIGIEDEDRTRHHRHRHHRHRHRHCRRCSKVRFYEIPLVLLYCFSLWFRLSLYKGIKQILISQD